MVPFPETFALHPNYPNPFNHRTIIQFDVATKSKVELTIYNLRGQPVRHLVSKVYEPGEYTIEWEGKDDAGSRVASGMYICQIVSENFRQSRKLLFLRF